MVRRDRQNQICVEFSAQVRAELAGMRTDGRILTEQEFIRTAVVEKLDRLKLERPGRSGPGYLEATEPKREGRKTAR